MLPEKSRRCSKGEFGFFKLNCVLLEALSITLLVLAHGQAQDCLRRPSGLTSWWRGEGNAFDSAGVLDGIVVSNVAFVPAISGLGFQFSGEGDEYVELPSKILPLATTELGGGPFTFETWLQTTNFGVILGQQDVIPFAIPERGYVPSIYVGTNGLLHVQMFWGSADQIVVTNVVTDGLFHHLAVTYDGVLQSLYLDGVLVSSSLGYQEGYAPAYRYQLGTGYTGGWPGAPGVWFPFAGVLDEPSVYNRALSSDEVLTIFNSRTVGKCVGPVLRHRYSFSDSPGSTVATESVRDAHGALLFATNSFPYTNGLPDGSTFGDGQLRLAGTNGYVALPPNLASWLSTATFEAWVTWFGPATSVWQRIFDFGLSDGGLDVSSIGTNYIILCPSRGSTLLLGFEETTVNPFGEELDPQALILTVPYQMQMGKEMYLAVTYAPAAGSSELYVDGVMVSSVSGRWLNSLNRISDQNCWLGRSQWQRDPHFNGYLNEFRIWDGVLSASTIADHFAAGPDQDLSPVFPPYLSFAAHGDELVISWPEAFAGYSVESADDLDSAEWTQVDETVELSNGNYTMRVIIGDGRKYYRLKK